MNALSKYYERIVLGHPAIVLLVLFVVLSFFAFHAKDFKLDASADSLILEDDKDLKIFREVNERYSIQDFLVVTFSPSKDLFSQASFGLIEQLQERLKQLERVASVITVLDVPLLKGLKLSEISPDKFKTLKDPAVDVVTAKQELVESPIYGDLLISEDGETTALIVNLKIDENFSDLLKKRNELLAQKRDGTLTNEEDAELENCLVDYERSYALFNSNRHQDIERIRSIIRPYEQYGVVRLGGVPMIADDMITFIKKDLTIFGFGVFFFIVLTLTIIFRKIRWVVLPLLSCFFAVSIMIGMLGFLNWKVTVISSNFISLMLILTMSMNIHLTVRYRQLCGEMSAETQKTIVGTTVRKMVWPSLYCALTTILGFSSLVYSNIRPVIDFGWMMTIGLSVTFGTSFLLFPAALMMLQKSTALIRDEKQSRMTSILASIVERHGGKVIVVSLVLAMISVLGITKLKVENSFINYFSKTTEIYQGMKLIDEKLGGTNPLDVIIKFEGPEDETAAEDDSAETEDDFDGGDEFGWVSNYDPKDYWFTPYKIAKIKEVHDYLDGLPEVGKVLSLASMVRAAEGLNEGREFDSLELSVLYKKIPDQIRATMVDPFISIDDNEARISVRIIDSMENIRRKILLEKIRNDLTNKLGFPENSVIVSGILVLYNNMLQSLFRSQILTLGMVMSGIAIMLLILFRSVSLALIGIIPNLLAVGAILGIMGLLDIPLDMMTITIAAITMGIAIDNSIHYMYRFREEFFDNNDYAKTLRLCHRNVGKAILNTSITIIFGFSILVLSNFIPTIYFGVFTGLAMFIALLAILTLLPKLILLWKPFKI